MTTKTVALFGAGATKACGGPLTNEILYEAFRFRSRLERYDLMEQLDDFLISEFSLPRNIEEREVKSYPALPLLQSLIDIAIERKQPFSKEWTEAKLINIRKALDYVVFALLDYQLTDINPYYKNFLRQLYRKDELDTVISLNYDVIVDNSLITLGNEQCHSSLDAFPFYGCNIATFDKEDYCHFGNLYKLHGSLNWTYCPGCHRLELGLSSKGLTEKKLRELFPADKANRFFDTIPLDQRYNNQTQRCAFCENALKPIMITPTHVKDYRNPHITHVWYHAERALLEAEKVYLIGYSLPEDDIEVIYLLKRTLRKVKPENIHVVVKDDQNRKIHNHPAGVRYKHIFGPHINWYTCGFETFVNKIA